ncbi:tetratricopeptide repeat protein [Pontibacter pamirensis]|uniref:tetratricopeptide repeat protein n=1 Tax=Pontibacter pamirensis TaxID=2562824 RepID=UPI00138997BF|nr:tetratricopeptide repeat protein [Pontibacter pamirensis]
MGALHDLTHMQKMVMSSIAQATINKVDSLNSKAWNLRVINSNQARLYSQEALQLSESLDYSKGKAESLRTLGFCYLRLSEHEKALQHLGKAFQLFKLLDDVKGQSDVLEYRGIISRSQGDYAVSLELLFKAAELREKINYQEGKSLTNYHLGITYKYLGNYSIALDYLLQCLSISKKNKFWMGESYSLNNIGLIYFENNDFANALVCFQKSLRIRKANGDQWGEAGCLDNIGLTFFRLGKCTEALEYCFRSLEITKSTGDKKGNGNSLFHLGSIYFQLKNFDKAHGCWVESQKIRMEVQDKKGQADILYCLSELYCKRDFSGYSVEQALSYLEEGVQIGDEIKAKDTLARIHEGYYKALKLIGRFEEALHHFEQHIVFEKEVHSEAMTKKVVNLEISHKIEQSKKETEIYRLRNVELANLNQKIKEQKKITEEKRDNLKVALKELRATQAQLVHSEKMASLGELTAGIAHEIQNPLNFINNFAEVGAELLEELRQGPVLQLQGEQRNEANQLLSDLEQSLSRIHSHGRRADSIVKSMLQHSRKNRGKMEATELNAFVKEHLRLSYHGLLAKDSTFTATIIRNFDDKVGKVEIVPQDLGRVLVNLFNNAFYALQAKQREQEQTYEPRITVSTRRLNDAIEIRVRDNGTGIPKKAAARIFQPFFTTKPNGHGTGLGLSMSYDIVTKGHGGKLYFETAEGQYTEFIVQVPVMHMKGKVEVPD